LPEPAQPKGAPQYQRIAEELRAEINEGKYDDGKRIPSEAEIVKQYGVSRGTARDALAVLHAAGLTEARRGSGVYVRTFPIIPRNAAQRLAKSQWGAGKAIWDADTQARSRREAVAEVSEVVAPERIAATLGLAPGGNVWKRARLYYVEGRSVQHATSYFPADLVAGSAITRPDTGAGGAYARLADLGHAPARFREEVRARMPLTDEAALLGTTMTTPIILIARTAFDVDGRPVEVNEMILDANSYVLEYDFTS
jgi:GntR family transcriptional regulator